ncbi:MAG TPA: ribulose-phosphate 3-epimerase [Candidatus Dormibacteraeota bacterium]|nr:ribulose-phosphate 3-epimerase [Candidatus Dormibacteraeota bacterium]
MKRIAASILAADFGRLGDEVKAVEAAGADWIHVDVMDGHFVPNLTIGPPVVAAIKRATRLPLDVHLMIANPERYIGEYVKAGATYISVHQETCPHLHAVVQDIRAHGCKPAVVLNPATPFHTLDDILPDLDMVLIMSVNPGFGGQSFIRTALDKLALASRVKRERQLEFLIEVDGGVKTGNVAEVSAAGAEVFVIGTGIFETSSYQATIAEIRGEMG